jgi:hypothetical protein
MKVIVAGGSGFIGRALCRALAQRGDEVVVLSRNPARARERLEPGATAAHWDGATAGPWAASLEGAAAVVNLCGEGVVERRWTPERKAALRSSRVGATRAIVGAIAGASRRPSVLVNTSAVGFYGARGDEEVGEEDGAGEGFLAQLCADWEREARNAEAHGVRVVMPRNGVVLGDGGALSKMLTPFRLFVGGPIGDGRQGFPWIHLADVVGIYLFAIDRSEVAGPVNATAPNPLSMKEFCKVLGRVLGRPSWAPVPAFVVRALYGEGAEVLLSGQRAVPRKIRALGYRFRFETAEPALRDLLRDRAAA